MAARFSIEDILEATGGALAGRGDSPMALAGVSTDTRTLLCGEAFFALRGECHDAHDHLGEAAGKGAALLVVSDASKAPAGFTGAVIAVEDTLRAYQDLAAWYLRRLDPFVVAVTGSVGKTTLKDMIACILSEYARVHRTEGNLNNQVGLPRTILSADEGTEALVVEMGMERAGEIERLADIARPHVCAITNIGVSHRENFGSDDGILRAKYEIASFLGKGGALVINPAGSAGLEGLAAAGSRERGFKLLRVAEKGSDGEASACFTVSPVRVDEADAAVSLFEIEERARGGAVSFSVPMAGTYAGVSAAMAAAACARAGVSLADAARALKKLARTPHRLEPVRAGGILVIDDTYNASPDSARSGLEYLKSVPAKRRIAVLADMNELGAGSEALHRETGAAAIRAGADLVYAFGGKAELIAEGAAEAAAARGCGTPRAASPTETAAAKEAASPAGTAAAKAAASPTEAAAAKEAAAAQGVLWFGPERKAEMAAALRAEARDGDAVYVKGSRSMKMEEIVRALTEGA